MVMIKILTLISLIIIPFASARERFKTTEVNEKTKAYWSFVYPQKSEVPNVNQKHPIDSFVIQKLQEKNIQPNSSASKQVLIRRAYYDLIGLPPTFEQVQAFVNDNSENAFEKIIDQLLSSPHYGEKWGRHWLDLVRYAETNGYERDGPKLEMWRYRDYVIDSFNSNKPYDQFVIEQLAGDELPNANADTITATGYYRLGIWDDEPADRELARYDYLDDIVKTTGDVFLGLTIACARCHDHKIDPIPTKDYYSMLAFFADITPHGKHETNLIKVQAENKFADFETWEANRNNLTQRIEEIESKFIEKYNDLQINKKESESILIPTAKTQTTEWKYTTTNPPDNWFEVGFSDASWDTGIAGFGTKGTPNAIVNTKWISTDIWLRKNFRLVSIPNNLLINLKHDEDVDVYLNGKKIYSAKGFINDYRIINVYEQAKDVLQTGKNVLAVRCQQTIGGQYIDVGLKSIGGSNNINDLLRKHGKELLGQSFQHYKRLKGDLAKHIQKKPDNQFYNVMAVAEKGTATINILERGNPQLKADEVQIAFPSILSNDSVSVPPEYKINHSSGKRRVLAEWITSDENPITSRVMVNRIWQYHFGNGIVRSPNDFGFQGYLPTHPELLDYLSLKFIESNYDIKAMHKFIMTSNAYQRSSAPSDENFEIDPLNKLLWKYEMRRLTGEEIRDSVLVAKGTINLDIGGPSVTPPLPDIILSTSSTKGRGWGKSTEEEANRRSVYVRVVRAMQMPLLINHDSADTDASCPVRFSTTVPTQALNMINGKFMNDSAIELATRILKESDINDIDNIIKQGLKLVLSNEPTSKQVEIANALVNDLISLGLSTEQSINYFALYLLNLNEFVYLD